jgi:hypothetical protein
MVAASFSDILTLAPPEDVLPEAPIKARRRRVCALPPEDPKTLPVSPRTILGAPEMPLVDALPPDK